MREVELNLSNHTTLKRPAAHRELRCVVIAQLEQHRVTQCGFGHVECVFLSWRVCCKHRLEHPFPQQVANLDVAVFSSEKLELEVACVIFVAKEKLDLVVCVCVCVCVCASESAFCDVTRHTALHNIAMPYQNRPLPPNPNSR
jgi:hypothetical protein